MYIKNVTQADDSMYGALGRYECHAFAVGEAVEQAKHGFSVSVITSETFPFFYFFYHSILAWQLVNYCNVTVVHKWVSIIAEDRNAKLMYLKCYCDENTLVLRYPDIKTTSPK